MFDLSPIHQVVRRLRWRLKAQTAVGRGVTAGTLALAGLAAGLLLYKLRVIEQPALLRVTIAAAALWLLGVGSALLARVSPIAAAQRLDRMGGLYDRLGSALAFASEPEPSAFQRAAMSDALAAVDRADPRAAAPWSRPRHLLWLLLALLAVGAVYLVDFPVRPGSGRGLLPVPLAKLETVERAALREEDKERLEVERERLADEAERASDPQVKEWIAKLNELIRALSEGRLTAEQAYGELAALERAREEWERQQGEGLSAIAAKLKKGAEKTTRAHKELDPLLDALREEQWKRAAEALEEMAGKQGELPAWERNRLGKDLARMAETIESERQRQRERLERERDRLRKKQKEQGDRFAEKERNRLRDKERQLERLQREQQAMSEARRQLERLQRRMDRAAQDLQRRANQGQPDAASEEMRKAAELLRRLSEQQKTAGQLAQGQARMREIKEMLRRAGKDGGKGGDQRERFLAKAGGGNEQGKEGKGGQCKGGGKDGKDGRQGVAMGEGQGGDKILLLGQQGSAQKQVSVAMAGQQGADNATVGPPGEGIGTGHDPNLMGEKTQLDSKTKPDFVPGRQGAGPSASRVVYTAASRGFTSQAYKAVHQDYSEVVEEQLDQQEIPPGQRRYVRRYFELIRPR